MATPPDWRVPSQYQIGKKVKRPGGSGLGELVVDVGEAVRLVVGSEVVGDTSLCHRLLSNVPFIIP